MFPPGTSWSYSNTNYLLAGLIAEKSTGRQLPRLIAERITRPLHLTDTYLATNTTVRAGHIHGYFPPPLPGGAYVDTTMWNPTAGGAAGAMVSTTSDLAHFYRALLSGRLLRPAWPPSRTRRPHPCSRRPWTPRSASCLTTDPG